MLRPPVEDMLPTAPDTARSHHNLVQKKPESTATAQQKIPLPANQPQANHERDFESLQKQALPSLPYANKRPPQSKSCCTLARCCIFLLAVLVLVVALALLYVYYVMLGDKDKEMEELQSKYDELLQAYDLSINT